MLLVDQALVPALRRALCNTPTTASALPAGRAHNDAVLFSPSQPARRVEIPRGAAVKIIGLQNAADLNGRSAKIQRFDTTAGRYRVQLDGDGDRCARVKPINLLQLIALNIHSQKYRQIS